MAWGGGGGGVGWVGGLYVRGCVSVGEGEAEKTHQD